MQFTKCLKKIDAKYGMLMFYIISKCIKKSQNSYLLKYNNVVLISKTWCVKYNIQLVNLILLILYCLYFSP